MKKLLVGLLTLASISSFAFESPLILTVTGTSYSENYKAYVHLELKSQTKALIDCSGRDGEIQVGNHKFLIESNCGTLINKVNLSSINKPTVIQLNQKRVNC